MKVREGSVVQLEYSLKLADDSLIDQTEEDRPLEFTVGEGKILPGLEKAVIGMELNEEKIFTLGPEEAYGPWRPELKMAYARMVIPEGFEPKKGDIFPVDLGGSDTVPARVVSVDDRKVVLDANHPLAGKELVFEVRVLSIS